MFNNQLVRPKRSKFVYDSFEGNQIAIIFKFHSYMDAEFFYTSFMSREQIQQAEIDTRQELLFNFWRYIGAA